MALRYIKMAGGGERGDWCKTTICGMAKDSKIL
jgi:hypothetical protein